MTVQQVLADPEAVATIIREVAALEIMPRFQKLAAHEITNKDSGEIVTAADHAAEAALSARLQPLIEGCCILGEEGADADPGVMELLTGEAPVWVIDPVDGTRNFAAGKRCFAVIIALCHGGQTIAGWIYDPQKDVTAIAVTGEGAWVDGARISVSTGKSMTELRGSLGPKRRKLITERRAAGVEVPAEAFRYGCAGMEYFHVADGTIDFAEYVSLKPWDHAAGVLIHREAGGYSADYDTGEPYIPRASYQGRLLLASDQACWRALHDLFAE